jgi:transcriptional regulator GlxA family with amidase domain
MVTVTILLFDYALAGAVMGMHDLLYYAGNVYQPQSGAEPRFTIRLASRDGKPVKVMNRLSLTPHCAVADISHSDVYLVPSITGDIEQTLSANSWLVVRLAEAGRHNSLVGSNSNGSFFLAEAGLLQGKTATTFWDNIELFRSRYPDVDLRPDQWLIHDGNVLCDAGGTSWFDLGLYLVELFCDHQTAMDTAKHFMVDLERSSKLSFTPLISKRHHSDRGILEIQDWLEAHYAEPVSIEALGRRFGLSNRSLLRRFKLATGVTPLNYLQEVRLDAACRLLVQSGDSIDAITHAVGYTDISSFIRLFKRKTNYSPSSYRARFRSAHGLR